MSDQSESEDKRPLGALRASVHNLFYNDDIFTALPEKLKKKVVAHYLSKYDIRNCRLVCRNWNSVIVKHAAFWVELSDISRFASMNIPSLEPLQVTCIVTRNLSRLSSPQQPTDILQYFRMRSPEDVKKVIFREGTACVVKTKILQSYPWIEELSNYRTSFPTLPAKTNFVHLKRLEIATKAFESGTTTKKFFLHTFFPKLEHLKLDFFARNDALQYMGAHYFAAAHHKSLKRLWLNFCYYLTDVDQFSKDELSNSEEVAKRNAALQSYLLKDKKFRKLDALVSMMKVEELVLNLSLNEGVHPWRLSLKMIESQSNLHKLVVQYPFVLKHFSFSDVIARNGRNIRQMSIPCVAREFDCSVLQSCITLESFSIGNGFSFNYLFFGTRGSLTNFSKFPALPKLRSISICVPLTKAQIMWLSAAMPTHSLLVYGMETEFFTFSEVRTIIIERRNLQKVMMRIYMTNEENQQLSNYFKSNAELIVTDYFHAEDCGFTTFVIERSILAEDDLADLDAEGNDDIEGDAISQYGPLVDDDAGNNEEERVGHKNVKT